MTVVERGTHVLLGVEGLHVSYGAIRALEDVYISVADGEIFSVIGANGAGKSTLLRTITGLTSPTEGRIVFDGHDITRVSPEARVSKGIALVPEGRHIFRSLTVRENLLIGAFRNRNRVAVRSTMEELFEWFPRLRQRVAQYGYSLSGGEQQMLAIARALMSKPRLLMIDEPSLGLAPAIVERVLTHIRNINQLGVAVLLVEQNASGALGLAQRAVVLENGRVVMHGAADKLQEDEEVRRAYLGL